MEMQLPKGVDSLRLSSRLDLVSFRNEAGGKRKAKEKGTKQSIEKKKQEK